jgi:cytochrome P450
MTSLDEAPYLDIFDPEFVANPAPRIDALRRQSCLALTPIGALVIQHAKVQELIADPRLRSSLLDFVRLQGIVDGPIHDAVALSLLALDGPAHARLRRLVSRAFTPRAVERLRPAMRALATELADRFLPRGSCEFMAEFADHYPIQMICELLGVPPEGS